MKQIKKKLVIGVSTLAIFLISIVLLTVVAARNEPPPQLVSNFVNVDNISKISKFRSCVGHVTVPQDQRETKRSMKHYFWVKPELAGTDRVKIYSPYDGYVSDVRSDPEEGLEGEVWIIPKRTLPMLPPIGVWQFSVQHIIVREDLKRGSEVKAGEILGHAAIPSQERASFDIVYATQALVPKMIDNWNSPFNDLDSVFNHMSEMVFAEYQNKGITSVDQMLINKEIRDSNNCEYQGDGPYFENQDDESNWIVLK